MAVHDVDAALIDQRFRECLLLARNVVAPISSPVNRNDHAVAGFVRHGLDLLRDTQRRFAGEIGQQMHA